MDQNPIPLDENVGDGLHLLEDKGEVWQLFDRAQGGSEKDKESLKIWVREMMAEVELLRRRSRKQELDFNTLFEIVGQTSARSLDLKAMQMYLLRTVSGHFTATKLMIFLKSGEEGKELLPSTWQGFRNIELRIPRDSSFCREGLRRRLPFFFDDLAPSFLESMEVRRLREWGMILVVPLVQDVEGGEAELEGFLLLGPRLANRAYSKQNHAFLSTLGKMLAICLRNEALYRRSIIDGLTGVASRGHFEAMMVQEIEKLRKGNGPGSLGLILLDLDKFKRVNDSFGHQMGDLVLKTVAKALLGQVRAMDLVARYGGEEFAVVLSKMDRVHLSAVADRLRQAIASLTLRTPLGVPIQITASFGAASFPEDALDRFYLIQKADMALYQAKDLGGNRVILAPS